MRAVDIITQKRDGQEMSTEEIEFFVRGFAEGEIPDYQAAAWAMAVYFQGMRPRETSDLTQALIATGEQLDLSPVVPFAVDKHSTGGVGDKTTLVIVPLIASLGVPIGKLSGKGLSFTGGTLDKMQSIPGYRIDLTKKEFLAQLGRVGAVLSGQSVDLAPAEGKLYGLRDVTGTVGSIPLIASSVMVKKLAAGADAILLDVKVGAGAFMHTVEEAEELAALMIHIGEDAGRRMGALLTDMNQPLGRAIGNALEVREAIDTLRGGGPGDFRTLCLEITAQLLQMAGRVDDLEAGRQMAAQALEDGEAFETFRRLVSAQSGDVSYVDDPERLPKAKFMRTQEAEVEGFVASVDAKEVGLTVVELGGGRRKKGDPIDHSVGVLVHVKVGDSVERGDALFSVHASGEQDLIAAVKRISAAIEISELPVEPHPLIYSRFPD
jgi:pyrimidine-nucleoside phosphorylase